MWKWLRRLTDPHGAPSGTVPPAPVGGVRPAPAGVAGPAQPLERALFGGDARAAAEARARVQALAPGELPRLEAELRRAMGYVPPAEARRWVGAAGGLAERFGPDAAPWLYGMLSFHASGHVREAAVRALAAMQGGEELRFLLLRANDWVGPVRREAVAALRRRLGAGHAGHFAAALPLLLRLEASGRAAAGDDVTAECFALLRSPEARDGLLRMLASGPHAARRRAFRLLAESGMEPAGLLEAASGNTDAVVRRMAVDVAARLPDGLLRSRGPALARDPAPQVRAGALRLLAERLPAEATPLLERGLTDASAAVRELSRWALRRPREAFAQACRAALDAQPTPGAIRGLAETGTPADVERLRPLLFHARPAVRSAAVAAAARLDGGSVREALCGVLADPSRRVSRAARRALSAQAGTLDAGWLRGLMGHAEPHVRVAALSLLGRRSRWEALAALLPALGDPDAQVAGTALSLLQRWRARLNRGAAQPSPAQRAALRPALDAAAGHLPPEMRAWLGFVLGGG